MPSLAFPRFSDIDTTKIEATVRELTESNLKKIDDLLAGCDTPTWENLMTPIETLDDQLGQYWAPVSHLNSVQNNPILREAYNACLPILANYATCIGQHEKLYQAVLAISQSSVYSNFEPAQQKIIKDHLRDFKLSGITLDAKKQARYKAISEKQSSLSAKFEENVLDCANAWEKLITDKALLAGVPERAITLAAEAAKAKDKTGWLITLDFPSYHAIVTYADNTALRKELYTAYCTRASNQGPHDKKYNNSEVMRDILALRQEKAKLLDFNNYAEYSLATKMADKPEEVISFLQELVSKTRPQAEKEYAALKSFAKDNLGLTKLNAWDMAYASEKMRQHDYDISQEQLRPYFPINRVFDGFFALLKKLFHIKLTEVKGQDVWHDDVQLFEIQDNNGATRAHVYVDLYAREKKRGGAWMDDCRVRRKLADGSVQLPIAFVTCNFSPAATGKQAMLDHDEVLTLFHEFGHALHHMLTKVDFADASGINGVPWDAVEFPSQFMEHWCWTRETLDMISGHIDTGEKLPEPLFDKMIAAKNFQCALGMLRQLEFSLFDFCMHRDYQQDDVDFIQHILKQIRDEVAVVPVPEFNRFAHGFSHIFAGGYAAGYYSYKWAEVLASDAFSRFEEEGLFKPEVGNDFLTHILEKGGSVEPKDLFVAFRGREPQLAALLRHNGIAVGAEAQE